MTNALTIVTDSSVNQLKSLQQIQTDLFKKLVPSDAPALPGLAAGLHLQQVQQALSDIAQRQLGFIQTGLPALIKFQQDGSALSTLFQFQAAFLQRLATQQTQFVDGLAQIAAQASQVRKVNTASKLMDQEYDLFAQFSALLVGQVTAFSELIENAQVDFAYLVAQEAEDQ